jgi:hypothetical protein
VWTARKSRSGGGHKWLGQKFPPAVGSIMDRVFFPFEVTRGRISECDSRGRVPRIVKLLDNPPNSRAVFLVIAGAFVHDRRPTITPNRIFAIAGLIGKGSDSSASGKIKSDCFLPHRCIQKHRSFFYERDPLELPQPLYVHWYFDKSEFRTSE